MEKLHLLENVVKTFFSGAFSQKNPVFKHPLKLLCNAYNLGRKLKSMRLKFKFKMCLISI